MIVDSVILILSKIIDIHGIFLGLFSGYYLLFIQRLNVGIVNQVLIGGPIDYFVRRKIDRYYWMFLINNFLIISFSLITIYFLFNNYLISYNNVIPIVFIIWTLIGFFFTFNLIKLMIDIMPMKEP